MIYIVENEYWDQSAYFETKDQALKFIASQVVNSRIYELSDFRLFEAQEIFLEEEMRDAESIRKDAGQVSVRGVERAGGEGEGGGDLQRGPKAQS